MATLIKTWSFKTSFYTPDQQFYNLFYFTPGVQVPNDLCKKYFAQKKGFWSVLQITVGRKSESGGKLEMKWTKFRNIKQLVAVNYKLYRPSHLIIKSRPTRNELQNLFFSRNTKIEAKFLKSDTFATQIGAKIN